MTPWAHRRLRRQVSAYLDGELDGRSAAAVERHIGRCWPCSCALEQLRLIKTSLGHLHRRRPDVLGARRLRSWALTLPSTSG